MAARGRWPETPTAPLTPSAQRNNATRSNKPIPRPVGKQKLKAESDDKPDDLDRSYPLERCARERAGGLFRLFVESFSCAEFERESQSLWRRR